MIFKLTLYHDRVVAYEAGFNTHALVICSKNDSMNILRILSGNGRKSG